MQFLIPSRQVSGSTKSILKSGLKPVTAATAQKNLSGAIPQCNVGNERSFGLGTHNAGKADLFQHVPN